MTRPIIKTKAYVRIVESYDPGQIPGKDKPKLTAFYYMTPDDQLWSGETHRSKFDMTPSCPTQPSPSHQIHTMNPTPSSSVLASSPTTPPAGPTPGSQRPWSARLSSWRSCMLRANMPTSSAITAVESIGAASRL